MFEVRRFYVESWLVNPSAGLRGLIKKVYLFVPSRVGT